LFHVHRYVRHISASLPSVSFQSGETSSLHVQLQLTGLFQVLETLIGQTPSLVRPPADEATA
jgi:hypothetical protein